MNDPRYKYRPLSAERKAALSRAHLRRLGVPEGYCLIYGEHIPVEIAQGVRTIAQTEARKNGREKAALVARSFSGAEPAVFRTTVIPPTDLWILAFWRHMTQGWQSPKQKLHGGWYLTRFRKGRGWQLQISRRYRCYPICAPECWTPILPALCSDSDTHR